MLFCYRKIEHVNPGFDRTGKTTGDGKIMVIIITVIFHSLINSINNYVISLYLTLLSKIHNQEEFNTHFVHIVR